MPTVLSYVPYISIVGALDLGLLLFKLDMPVLGLVLTGLFRTTFLEPEGLSCASFHTIALVPDDPCLYPKPSSPLGVFTIDECETLIVLSQFLYAYLRLCV